MDYGQLLARYEDALDTILELQIWELCCQNDRLRRALNRADSADPGSKLLLSTDGPETS